MMSGIRLTLIRYHCYELFVDEHQNEVGRITKYWAGGKTGCGCCIECFNSSTHVIQFPPKATTEQKASIVGAAILLVSS